jgi:hypothetical protein
MMHLIKRLFSSSNHPTTWLGNNLSSPYDALWLELFGQYQATVMLAASSIHCPPRAALAEAITDAGQYLDADAQVLRLHAPRRVFAGREVGSAWLLQLIGKLT